MSLEGIAINKSYLADGVLTSFIIPFAFQSASQIVVTTTNTAVPPVTSLNNQGVQYSVVGTNVVFVVAPTAGYTVTMYRLTPRTQIYDMVNSQPTLNETIETAMDRIVMMLQEIEGLQSPGTIIAPGGYAVALPQVLAAAGTVAVSPTAPRQICPVQGPPAGGTASATTPIGAGSVNGQELLLEGTSNSDTLIIPNTGNVLLDGSCTLHNGSTLKLYWSTTRAKWVESARSVK